MADSGQIIRKLREERFLKSSDIERLSRAIGDSKDNTQYYIAHASLSEIEAGSVPGIFKIESLAIIFKIPLLQMLMVFGIDPHETEQLASGTAPRQTELEPTGLVETGLLFRLNFDNRVNPRETGLLPDKPEEWGLVPAALAKRLHPERFIYAVVGLDDDRMGEIIPPGTLVEIDREQNVIQEFSWRTLRERPIYLVWHDDGYSCGWCQQDRNELLISPHPASRRPVLRLKAREATIIGRIVHAWCSFQSAPEPC